MSKPNYETHQSSHFTAHLIEIPPHGRRRVELLVYPPTAEQLNYLTDGWGVEKVPGWTTHDGLPCAAYCNSIKGLHEPNATATKLWKAQNPDAKGDLEGVIVLIVAPPDFLHALDEDL